jgi:hypothetical protein
MSVETILAAIAVTMIIATLAVIFSRQQAGRM